MRLKRDKISLLELEQGGSDMKKSKENLVGSVESIAGGEFCWCESLTSITFKDTSTWYRTDDYNNWQNQTGGTETDVTNASINANNFKSNYYWYKK
jgi:prolyl oligopeptidase PreP (S9A serine peptidase family)